MEPINDGINEFNVEFHGPKESNVKTIFALRLATLHIYTFISTCLIFTYHG